MKTLTILTLLILGAGPTASAAQETPGLRGDLARDYSLAASWITREEIITGTDRTDDPQAVTESLPELSGTLRSAGLHLLQDEIGPNLHFGLAAYLRLDVPGDTSVDSSGNIAYSDIFDAGYGLNVEASLMSWLTPHWAFGGYLSIGWDRFAGSSNVDMGTGEFFSFGDQDTVSVIVGGKVFQKFAPFWFWEGRMGLGLIHYGELTFTDVTTAIPVSGLQFFKATNHGLFDMGGRVGLGNSRLTFDLGLDFRFMGGEGRGRDVSNVIDPDLFFVFSLDLGLSIRF